MPNQTNYIEHLRDYADKTTDSGSFDKLSSTSPATIPRRRALPGLRRKIQYGLSPPHLESCTVISSSRIDRRIKRPQPDPGSLPGRISDLRRILPPRSPPHPSVVLAGGAFPAPGRPILKRAGLTRTRTRSVRHQALIRRSCVVDDYVGIILPEIEEIGFEFEVCGIGLLRFGHEGARIRLGGALGGISRDDYGVILVRHEAEIEVVDEGFSVRAVEISEEMLSYELQR